MNSENQSDGQSDLKGKRIVFINTGSYKKKFILERAKELGVTIILVNSRLPLWAKSLVDYYVEADTYSVENVLERLKKFLKENKTVIDKFDGTITFWEDDVTIQAAVAAEFNLIDNSPQIAEYCRNKYLMREQFRQHNVLCAKQKLLLNAEDLEVAMKEIGFPGVLKPVWGADSEFVVKANNEEEARQIYDYIYKNATPKFNPIFKYNQSQFIYEEYLEGVEVTVESLTQNGATQVVAISEKSPMKEPYFMERGDIMPSRFESPTLKKIQDIVEEGHKALGIQNSISHTEVKITPKGPAIVEVAARMGGDYLCNWVKTVWEVDLVEQGLRIATGLLINFQKPAKPKTFLAGTYLIPETSGVVTGLRGFKALNRHPDIHEIRIFKRVGDSVLVPPSGFETIGWIVTHGQSHYQAQQNLEEVIEGVSLTVTPYEPISSIGQTKRKNPFSAASVIREHILRSSKIERLRYLPTKPLPKSKVGVLCNIYAGDSEVENDLTKVGNSIKKTLEARGHKVIFFDMNEDPLPIVKLMRSDVDIVFNVCERINDSSYLEPHGAALLDILQIPYSGSNPQTLALCIDKIRVKKLLDYHSIPTPKWDYAFSVEDEIDSSLRYPLMVKPASTDNSIGITNDSVVTTPEQLKVQIERCLKLAPAALIEEYIEGDEYDVTIIGNDDEAMVLPLSRSMFEDLPKNIWHIYPYNAKWQDDSVYNLIKVERPALIPAKLAKIISEIALDTYNILDCHDYGRVEIRVDKEGNPFVLELNPNPSIDENDCVPACAELIGQNYGDFLEEIIGFAIQRYRNSPPYAHLQSSF